MSDFEYDPTLIEFQLDPLPIFRTLRDEHPAYSNERRRFWALTRWEDVWNAAVDWQTFASDPVHYGESEEEPIDTLLGVMDPGMCLLA